MSIKKICIVGPGALGGMMAVHWQRAGYDVSALARPEKVAAVNAKGITLLDGGQIYKGQPRMAATSADLGPQDLVVVTLKADGLAWAIPHLAGLSHAATPWVFVMNGVPWWFFSHFGGKFKGAVLNTIDPDGLLAKSVPLERLIWGVINCNVIIKPDGTLSHEHSNQLQLGRPNQSHDGTAEIAQVFKDGGYNTEVTDRIHHAIWTKVLSNMIFNPLSALTATTLDRFLGDPLVRDFAIKLTDEGRAVGEALGIPSGPSGAERFDASRTFGPARTSMLSDLERGRALEVAPLIGAVVEIADLCGVPVPMTKVLYGLIRVRTQAIIDAGDH